MLDDHSCADEKNTLTTYGDVTIIKSCEMKE